MFEEYDYIADEVIATDSVLSKYEDDLATKSKYVDSLIFNTPALQKFLHPIRLIRTKQEAKRLAYIKNGYEELKKSPLIEHFDEESGELDHDFHSAATYFKPRRMRLYAQLYPVYIKQDEKLLQRKR